jgi:hypothetical protein
VRFSTPDESPKGWWRESVTRRFPDGNRGRPHLGILALSSHSELKLGYTCGLQLPHERRKHSFLI